jgi:hypothetical protein
MSGRDGTVRAFREFARRYSIACRHADNMAKRGRNDDLDEAIAQKQEIEREFCECFRLTGIPMRAPA